MEGYLEIVDELLSDTAICLLPCPCPAVNIEP